MAVVHYAEHKTVRLQVYEKSEMTMACRILMMEELELEAVVLTGYHRLGLVW